VIKRIVVAEHKRATETIVAEHYPYDKGSYRYCVRILGGKYHDLEFRCRTEESAMWLFDQVVDARMAGRDWNWLTGESNDSTAKSVAAEAMSS
jgi:hypothetical protein